MPPIPENTSMYSILLQMGLYTTVYNIGPVMFRGGETHIDELVLPIQMMIENYRHIFLYTILYYL